MAAYYASQVKAETEKSEQDKVLERRIREIQEYFGYWIDPKDPRFEVMLKQKEAEEKKVCFSVRIFYELILGLFCYRVLVFLTL